MRGMALPRRFVVAATLSAAIGCVLWHVVPVSPRVIEEHYSRRVYPLLARLVVPVADVVPVTLTGCVLLGLLPGVALLCFARARKRRRVGLSRWKVAGALGWDLAALGVWGYAGFLALWGAGYAREPLPERLGLTPEQPGSEDVSRWTKWLLERVTRSANVLTERDEDRALASLRESLVRVLARWDGVEPALPTRVKLLPAGALLRFGNAGVTSPYFLEAHVDAALPAPERLSVGLHELAHVAGLCSEAAADLAAAVAGLEASDPYATYAVALDLLERFAGELPRGAREEVLSALPSMAREDLRAAAAARTTYQNPVLVRAQSMVYDAYLRSQRLKEGSREYTFLTRLLLAAEKKGVVSLHAR